MTIAARGRRGQPVWTRRTSIISRCHSQRRRRHYKSRSWRRQSGMYFTHFRPDGTDSVATNVWRAFGLDSKMSLPPTTLQRCALATISTSATSVLPACLVKPNREAYNLTQITLTTNPADPYGFLDVAVDPESQPDTIITFNINTDVDWIHDGPPTPTELDDGLATMCRRSSSRRTVISSRTK